MISSSDIARINTQFDIPRTINTIERSALRELINTFRTYRVILVTAPPGYGKTTTVAQFVDRVNIPTAWHTFEERDRDLPNLQQHNLKALRSVAPGIDDVPEAVLTPRESATYITSYIRDHVDEDILYVLDDLQLIVGSFQAESWLQSLVELLPAKCHLILISRNLPDLPLAELIAKRAVIAIGQDQLRFTQDEASSLARAFGSAISDEQIRQRVKHLEGWPAGVAMSLQPLPDDIEASILKGQQGPEALFSTLAAIMLQKQSPVLRDFLLSSSVLSRLTPELCHKLLDLPNSENALALTRSRGLFVSQVASGLTYHRLFRSFLQLQLKHTNPARYRRLHGNAGDWYRDQGDIDTAFEHYIAAEMIDEALSIVERAHMAYFNQGKVETLLTWRSMLGEHAERIPQLIYKCAMIYTDRYLYKDAEGELDIAKQMFEESDDRIGLADVSLQRTMIMMRRGEHQAIIPDMISVLEDPSLPPRIVARAKHYLALSYLALGETDFTISLLAEILPIYESSQDLYALSAVLQDMEVAYTQQGRMDEASHCLQRVVSLRRRLGRPNALALALNNLGYHYHQRRNYQEAIRTLDEGLQIVEETSNRRAESYLLWTLGDVRRDLGEFETALDLYNRAYELSSGMEPSLQRSVTLSMSTLYRWQQEYALAERLATDVAGHTTNQNTPDHLVAQAKMWMAYAHQSDTRQAGVELDNILDALRKHKAPVETKLCLLFCAHISLLCGADYSEQYLSECLSTKPETQNRCPQEIIAEIAHSPQLKQYVFAKPRYRIIQDAVMKLEAHRNRLEVAKPSSIETTDSKHTYSVRVLTLGKEIIERDGVLVPTSAWRASRAREFFLYLLFEGAQTRDAISLTFWPDHSAKRVRSNFHTTLYRTRQALGDNAIVFEDERYALNPEIEISCDAAMLEDCVRQAKLLPPKDARAEDLYHRAIHLYRGSFLPSLDANWIDSHRNRLHETYMEALFGAGQCARARHDYKEAISLYQRILELDQYREEAYRAIFACYAHLGEPYRVITHFREMERLFRVELGINPSAETVALVQTLI